jgi:Kef-type K+ transport system membrane component KefB
MAQPGFGGLLVVVSVAFLAPFLLGLFPRLRLPSVVFEIVAGIVIGPSVFGWVEVDQTIEVLALIGLAYLLFLAGLEIDFTQLRARLLALALLGWAVSFALAAVAGYGLKLAGLVNTPLLVAIILSATSLGVIIPVLADVGELNTKFGQLVLAAASIADFGAVILLSLFFSGESGPGSTAVLLSVFAGLLLVTFFVVRTAEHSRRVEEDLLRLQDSSAQIRVRAAMVLMIAIVALAEELALEVILGAFAAGAAVAGILQATSLPFIVAATAIGMELGAVDSAEASALIAAGLLSVLIFPLAGLVMLRRGMSSSGSPQAAMETRAAL